MNPEFEVLSVDRMNHLNMCMDYFPKFEFYWSLNDEGKYILKVGSKNYFTKNTVPTLTAQDIIDMLPGEYIDFFDVQFWLTIEKVNENGINLYIVKYATRNDEDILFISKNERLIDSLFSALLFCLNNIVIF